MFPIINLNLIGLKDVKKLYGIDQEASVEESRTIRDDYTIPEAPKMIVFGMMSHLQPSHISSYSDAANRSERLRCYNLNDAFFIH